MAKQLVTHEKTKLSRKERKALASIYQNMVRGDEVRADETEKWPIPTQGLTYRPEFWSLPVKRPYHRGTGFELAAANPFSAAYIHDPAGPVVGIERLSGGAAFTFDPWELYLRGECASPNLLIEGSLRQGKSFIIKRLICLLAMLGRNAINVSDSKGEHGAVAEAIGGNVYKMGVFGSEVRINPLQAGDRRTDELDTEYAARVKAARVSVMQQIAGLLNPGERPVTGRESAILDWALEEVVKESDNRPTLRAVWEKLSSRELEQARGGYFERHDARDLADGLRRVVHGDLGGMFDTHSSIELDAASPYTVIDTFAINQRGSGALAVTQAVTNAFVQNTISNKSSGRRYFLIREEGWRDMKTRQALESHQEQLKLSGEYGIAMVLIVHEGGDFDSVGPEGSVERELAKSLLRGYANRICFWQPQAALLNAVTSGTYTEAEARAIASLSRGNFLVKLRSGSYVVDGTPTTTSWEQSLFDTDHQMRERAAEAA
ncbi:MAG: hypothetical protein ACTJFR_01155 [Canibacter sp.]